MKKFKQLILLTALLLGGLLQAQAQQPAPADLVLTVTSASVTSFCVGTGVSTVTLEGTYTSIANPSFTTPPNRILTILGTQTSGPDAFDPLTVSFLAADYFAAGMTNEPFKIEYEIDDFYNNSYQPLLGGAYSMEFSIGLGSNSHASIAGALPTASFTVYQKPNLEVVTVTDSICNVYTSPYGKLEYHFNVTNYPAGTDVRFDWGRLGSVYPIIGLGEFSLLIHDTTYKYDPFARLADPTTKGKNEFRVFAEVYGCISDTLDFQAIVMPTPQVTITANTDSICDIPTPPHGALDYDFDVINHGGVDVEFRWIQVPTATNTINGIAGGAHTYTGDGTTSNSIGYPYTPAGIYLVTPTAKAKETYKLVVEAEGCISDTADFKAVVMPKPTLAIAPLSDTVCDVPVGTANVLSYVFTAGNLDGVNARFYWTQFAAEANTISGMTNGAITVASPYTRNFAAHKMTANDGLIAEENYHVRAEANGCVSDTFDIRGVVMPKPVLAPMTGYNLIDSMVFCAGGTIDSMYYNTTNTPEIVSDAYVTVVAGSNGYGTSAFTPPTSWARTGTGNRRIFLRDTPRTLENTVTPKVSLFERREIVARTTFGCWSDTAYFTLRVNPEVEITGASPASGSAVCNGSAAPTITFTSDLLSPTITDSIQWSIVSPDGFTAGLAASGVSTGTTLSLGVLANLSDDKDSTLVLSIIPYYNGCPGVEFTYSIIVRPTPKTLPIADIVLCEDETSPIFGLKVVQGSNTISYRIRRAGSTGAAVENLATAGTQLITGVTTAWSALTPPEIPAILADMAKADDPDYRVRQTYDLEATLSGGGCTTVDLSAFDVIFYPVSKPTLEYNLSTLDTVHGQPWGLFSDSLYPATTPIVTFKSTSGYVIGFKWEKIGGEVIGLDLGGTVAKDAADLGSIMGGWKTVRNDTPDPIFGHYMVYPLLTGDVSCKANLEFDIYVRPWPIDVELIRVDDIETVEICSSVENPAFAFTGNLPGGTYKWEIIADSTKPVGTSQLGMPLQGVTTTFPAFTYVNTTEYDVEFAYLVTPQYEQANLVVPNVDSAKIFKVIVKPEPVLGAFTDVRVEHDSTVVIPVMVLKYGSMGELNTIEVTQLEGDMIGVFDAYAYGDNQLTFTAENTSGRVLTAKFLVTPISEDGFGNANCAGQPQVLVITVNPKYDVPFVNVQDFVYYVGDHAPQYTFTGGINNTFDWEYKGIPAFAGLPLAGANIINSFTALVAGNYIYEVTPILVRDITVGAPIVGTPSTFTITILARPIVDVVIPDQTLCSGASTALIGAITDSCRIELAAGVDVLNIMSSFDGHSIAAATVTNTSNVAIFGRYKLTPLAADGVTEGTPVEFTITVKPIPQAIPLSPITVYNGDVVGPITFTGTIPDAEYAWVADTTLGNAVFGVNILPQFIAKNTTNAPLTVTFDVVTATYQGCIAPVETDVLLITVNPKVIPDHENFRMVPIADQSVCAGTNTTAITFDATHETQTLGTVTYKAEHIGGAAILGAPTATGYGAATTVNTGSTPLVGTYRVTPYWNNFEGKPYEFTITVKPIPVVTPITNVTVYNGDVVGPFTFSGNIPDAEYRWYASNPIGAPSTGINTIPPFTAINTTELPIIGQFDVEVDYQGCAANPYTVMALEITVLPKTIIDEDFLMTPIASKTLCAATAVADIPLASTHRYPASIGGLVANDVVYEWKMVGKEVFTPAKGTSGTITAGTNNFAGGNLISTTEEVTATYTVTPVYKNRRGVPTTFSITVLPIPNVNIPANQIVCNGGMTDKVTFSASNNVNNVEFTWDVVTAGFVHTTSQIGLPVGPTGGSVIDPQVVTNTTNAPLTDIIQVKARYHVNSDNGICEGTAATFTITVNPTPVVDPIANITVPSGTAVPAQVIAGSTAAANTTYNWTNDNTTIGLNVAAGVNTVDAFIAMNNTQTNQIATIRIYPTYTNNGIACTGEMVYYTITVLPVPEIVPPSDMVVCENEYVMIPLAAETDNNAYFTWISSNHATGLVDNNATGIKYISFTATNVTAGPIFTTVTVTPHVVVNGVVADGTPYDFTITVNPITDIYVQPVQPAPVCEGETVTLSVTSEGSAVLFYQWFKDGAPLTTADNATALSQTLVITDITAKDAGNYYVQVTGACGMDESVHVDVVVYLSNLVVQKKMNILMVNCNVATNGGYDFVGFQWYKNGVRLTGEVMSNYQETSTINTTDVYYVVLTTSAGKMYRTCGTSFVTTATIDPIVITIAPNPVSAGGTITATVTGMSTTDLASLKYVLVNTTGRSMLSVKGSVVTSITMPNMVGIYVLRAEYASGYKTYTIIVK